MYRIHLLNRFDKHFAYELVLTLFIFDTFAPNKLSSI